MAHSEQCLSPVTSSAPLIKVDEQPLWDRLTLCVVDLHASKVWIIGLQVLLQTSLHPLVGLSIFSAQRHVAL